jgi:hypothetical protein
MERRDDSVWLLLLAKIKPVQLALLAEHNDARRRSSAFQQ